VQVAEDDREAPSGGGEEDLEGMAGALARALAARSNAIQQSGRLFLSICIIAYDPLLLHSLSSQGVDTYMSPVEAFATGIKMESSDQRSFLELIKGS